MMTPRIERHVRHPRAPAGATAGLLALVGLVVASAVAAAPAAAAPKEMTRDEIVQIAKTIPGFSYWWGGSKWSPGSSNKGKCTPNAGSSGCPKCSHSGPWGADCSGFVGKAWQIAVPKPLDVAYHPYATSHFASQSTWWTTIKRSSAQKADAFNYNKNGAGHIFLYEKGDPWGSVWAWECAGCKPGCKYSLRSVASYYEVKQRKLLKAPVTTCKPHCEGSVKVDAKCGKGDCAKYGSKCVDDSLGVRCVFGMCPNKGKATICLPDGKHGTCSDGALKQVSCGSGKQCVKLSSTSAACKPVCPKSCDDGNPCTKDGCDPKVGTCSHAKLSGPVCWDGSKCTAGEKCVAGVCKGGSPVKSCDDGQPCTADGCDGKTGNCTHSPSGGACDDGDACTVGDACKGGACKAGAAKACSDGDACNGVESCVGGACKGGAAVACDDGDACTADACDPATGACSHVAKACDDGDACTVDTCVKAKGACVHTASACDDGNACTDDACDSATGACSSAAAAAPCDDGDPCTADKCVGASCHHLPAVGACGDGTWVCLAGMCVPPQGGGGGGGGSGGSGSGGGGTGGGSDVDAGAGAAVDGGGSGGGGGGSVAGGSDGGAGLDGVSEADDASARPKRPPQTNFAPAPASGCSAAAGSRPVAPAAGWLVLAALALIALRRRTRAA